MQGHIDNILVCACGATSAVAANLGDNMCEYTLEFLHCIVQAHAVTTFRQCAATWHCSGEAWTR